jgi:subtilisin family serine protease
LGVLALSGTLAAATPGDRHRLLLRTAPGVGLGTDREGGIWFMPGEVNGDLSSLLNAALIRSVLNGSDVVGVEWVFAGAEEHALSIEHRLDRYVVIEFETAEALASAASAVEPDAFGDGLIEWAGVDPEGGVAAVPDDPSFALQYALQNTGQTINGQPGLPGADIGVVDAWSWTTGSPNVTVAVLDAGVDQHVEFADRLQPGWNVPDQNDDVSDQCMSHGTNVSGIIGARGNNGVGVAGVAWGIKLLPVVVLDGCSGYESWVSEGIYWAVEHGADLINYSLQYSTGTPAFQDAVAFAHASGVLQIAAAGNTGAGNDVQAPGRFSQTICVAAIDNTDTRWAGSSQGPEIDLSAAGWGVYACRDIASYGYSQGTSMAAPHVTGIVALLKSLDGDLTQEVAVAVLRETAEDLASPGRDEQTGFGRPDAWAAIGALGVDPPPAGDLNHDGAVDGIDFGMLLAGWGPCGDCEEDPCPGDLNGDCVVNGNDVGLLLVDWTL